MLQTHASEAMQVATSTTRMLDDSTRGAEQRPGQGSYKFTEVDINGEQPPRDRHLEARHAIEQRRTGRARRPGLDPVERGRVIA